MASVIHIDSAEIVIRAARESDGRELARIAGRDTGAMPEGPILVAQVGSDIRAAISLNDGHAVADPFHRTAELVEMLRIRAGAVAASRRPAQIRRRRRRPALRSAA